MEMKIIMDRIRGINSGKVMWVKERQPSAPSILAAS